MNQQIELTPTIVYDLEDVMRARHMENKAPFTILSGHPETIAELDKHLGYLKPTGDPAHYNTLSYRWGVVRVVDDSDIPVGTVVLY